MNRSADEIDRAIKAALESGGDQLADVIPNGLRTASCSALNYLELARLGREDFLEMARRFPVLRRRLVEQSLADLRSETGSDPGVGEYVEQGINEGQSIRVLDRDLGTR